MNEEPARKANRLAQAEAADERQSEKAPVTKQHPEALEQAPDPDRHPILAQPGFGKQGRRQDERQTGEEDRRDEYGAPTEGNNQRAAGERGENGRDAEHEHHERHQASGLRPGVEIADDRPRNHHHRGSAEALEKAEADQPSDGRRGGAADRAEHEQREAEIKRRLATDHVRNRTVSDLTDAEGDKESHQRHLRRARGSGETGRDRRQRRQVHVDCEGSDGGQQAEDNSVPDECRSHSCSRSGRSEFCCGPPYGFGPYYIATATPPAQRGARHIGRPGDGTGSRRGAHAPPARLG